MPINPNCKQPKWKNKNKKEEPKKFEELSYKDKYDVRAKQIQIALQSLLVFGIFLALIGYETLSSYGASLGIPIDWNNIASQSLGGAVVLVVMVISISLVFPSVFLNNQETQKILNRDTNRWIVVTHHVVPVFLLLIAVAGSYSAGADSPEAAELSAIGFFAGISLLLLFWHVLGNVDLGEVLFKVQLKLWISFVLINMLSLLFCLTYILFFLAFKFVSEDWEWLIVLIVTQVAISTLTWVSIQDVKKGKGIIRSGSVVIFVCMLAIFLFPESRVAGRLALLIHGQGGGLVRVFWISKGSFDKIPYPQRNGLDLESIKIQNGGREIRLCLWYSGNGYWYVSKQQEAGRICKMQDGLIYQRGIFSIEKQFLEMI